MRRNEPLCVRIDTSYNNRATNDEVNSMDFDALTLASKTKVN